MFYISSVSKPKTISGWNETIYDKVGITDTEDGVEEFFTNAQVVKLEQDKNIGTIYGCYCYGKSKYEMYAFCTPMTLGQSASGIKFIELADAFKKMHNPWHLYPVRDYLASLKVGTIIIIDYKFVGDGDHRTHRCTGLFRKTGIDTWDYEDDNSGWAGKGYTAEKTSHAMDYLLCCYTNITVR